MASRPFDVRGFMRPYRSCDLERAPGLLLLQLVRLLGPCIAFLIHAVLGFVQTIAHFRVSLLGIVRCEVMCGSHGKWGVARRTRERMPSQDRRGLLR
jgi:hypothetical protein